MAAKAAGHHRCGDARPTDPPERRAGHGDRLLRSLWVGSNLSRSARVQGGLCAERTVPEPDTRQRRGRRGIAADETSRPGSDAAIGRGRPVPVRDKWNARRYRGQAVNGPPLVVQWRTARSRPQAVGDGPAAQRPRIPRSASAVGWASVSSCALARIWCSVATCFSNALWPALLRQAEVLSNRSTPSDTKAASAQMRQAHPSCLEPQMGAARKTGCVEATESR
jgi:hypothetical protein